MKSRGDYSCLISAPIMAQHLIRVTLMARGFECSGSADVFVASLDLRARRSPWKCWSEIRVECDPTHVRVIARSRESEWICRIRAALYVLLVAMLGAAVLGITAGDVSLFVSGGGGACVVLAFVLVVIPSFQAMLISAQRHTRDELSRAIASEFG